jgi:NhaA family Na+:H+ antiporter
MQTAENTSQLVNFFKLEAASGIILIAVTILALVISNSVFYPLYKAFLTTPLSIQFGELGLNKPVLLWINDGLMAIFFCSVAVEIKKKLFSDPQKMKEQITFPAIGALGGVIVPALIFLFFNINHPENMRGWAIPTATDIAFSLGVLALFSTRVPVSLKLFLVLLAVIDDLSAIIIIALFYTGKLSLLSLALAAVGCVALFALNRFKVNATIWYIMVGFFLWVCMVKSGVHATLTGVIVGLSLPMHAKGGMPSPLDKMEHDMKYWVAYFHLPLFAFANAGVPLTEISFGRLMEPLALGIALGLFIGKPLGVMGFTWLAYKMKLFRFPEGINWLMFIGVAVLTGIGFTMSLFIGTLAFEEELMVRIRIGVLTGSFLAAGVGCLLIWLATRKQAAQ